MKMFKFNHLLIWIGLVVLSFSAVSCGKAPLFDNNMAIRDSVWKADENVLFEVNVTDTAKIYKFYVNIRHTEAYRYSNLYVFLNTRFPNGNITRDTLECLLATPEGKWLGKGFGELKDNQILLNSALRFPLKGKYIFELEQGMRVKELKDISDIGIRIERAF
jgi:gliding motility-associated lipoprotein GldH